MAGDDDFDEYDADLGQLHDRGGDRTPVGPAPIEERRRRAGRRRRREVVLAASAAAAAVVVVGGTTLLDRPAGASGSGPEHLFSCPERVQNAAEAPATPDVQRQRHLVAAVRERTWNGFTPRWVTPTRFGVVALVTGNLGLAKRQLSDVGVRHVFTWDPSGGSVRDDARVQMTEVLGELVQPAMRDVGRRSKAIAGRKDYLVLGSSGETGTVFLQWKAPVPRAIRALAGSRPDGVRVIVTPTRYSSRDLQAATTRVLYAINTGQVRAAWSMSSSCGDGSGLVVGIEPPSLAHRRARLQQQLTKVAGVPIYAVPREAPVPAVGTRAAH